MHAATRRSGYPADSVRPHLPLHTSGVSSVQIWPRDATPGAPAPPGRLAGHDVSPILRGPPQSLVCTSRGLAGDAICPGRPLIPLVDVLVRPCYWSPARTGPFTRPGNYCLTLFHMIYLE